MNNRKLSHRALKKITKSAMKSKWLPPSLENSIDLMAETGIPNDVFRYSLPLRKIIVSQSMDDLPYLGAYFGTRLEISPSTMDVDWESIGWDGKPRMMIFPNIPESWVFMHEFGHYIDDTFVRAIHTFDLNLSEFDDLYEQMKKEFLVTQEIAMDVVEGIEQLKWWNAVPYKFVRNNAPSHYALSNFSEWFAETFQTLCRWGHPMALSRATPKTAAFMEYFLSGNIFSKPVSYFSMASNILIPQEATLKS